MLLHSERDNVWLGLSSGRLVYREKNEGSQLREREPSTKG